MEAVKVNNLVKKFKIPHLRRDTVREGFVNIFNRPRYEVFNAVDDLSFSLEEGGFLGVIGKNGSGKSTLLKILAGVYEPSSGEVSTVGRVAPFLELGVGFNSELSGRDNVYLSGTILGLTKREIAEKYDKIVEFAELERFMDQQLKNYSSGMYVRLAFAIAMQSDADIFLLDEVLAVGDKDFQDKCYAKFMNLKKNAKTVVYVTHNLDSVKDFCDSVLYMKDGKMEGMGSSEEMINLYLS